MRKRCRWCRLSRQREAIAGEWRDEQRATLALVTFTKAMLQSIAVDRMRLRRPTPRAAAGWPEIRRQSGTAAGTALPRVAPLGLLLRLG